MARGRTNNNSNKKRSGSKFVDLKNGGQAISGWNYSKNDGLVDILVVPTDEVVKSKNGTEYQKAVANVTFKSYIREKLTFSAFVELERNGNDVYMVKARIPDMKGGFVLNPSANNGGYCGTSNYQK